MNRRVVLDNWKWIVESVQKSFPALIRRGFAEANRVILEGTPTDEKNVSVLNLKATTKLMRNIPWGCRDNSRGDFKRGFKLCAMARQDRENGYLENFCVAHFGVASNDEVERRGVALPPNETDLSQSSTSLRGPTKMRSPRSLELIVLDTIAHRACEHNLRMMMPGMPSEKHARTLNCSAQGRPEGIVRLPSSLPVKC
jgi:hypothetical protein